MAKNLKHLEELLEKELDTVQKELERLGRRNPGNPADWEALPEKMDVIPADDNETADSIEAYEENTAILKQLEIRYNEIKTAIQKIQDGDYGKCEICASPIEDDRLEANPAARTCKKHLGEERR